MKTPRICNCQGCGEPTDQDPEEVCPILCDNCLEIEFDRQRAQEKLERDRGHRETQPILDGIYDV